MAVYTETVKLEDQVSPAAKHAATSVLQLSKGLEAAQRAMIKANALGDSKAFNKLATQHDALSAAIKPVSPALLAEVAAAKALDAASAAAAARAAALVKEEAALAAAAKVAASVIAKEEAAIVKKNAATAKAAASADAAAAKVGATLSKAGAVAKVAADANAKAALSLKSIDKSSADAAKSLKVVDGSAFNFAAAMGVVKGSVTAAVGGIKKAFTSLAAGDVKGAIEGVTAAVGGMVKLLDLAVPGLGTAAETVVMIAGGLIGVAAGLIKSGALFALTVNDTTGRMAAMKEGFSASIKEMFTGIKIGPFMDQLESLFEIFDQSKPSGQAMKAAIGGAFNKVFEVLTKLVPVVKHFFLDLVILALKAYIALRPIKWAIDDFLASATGMAVVNTVLESLWTVLKAVGLVLLVVVGAFLAVWVASTLVAVALWTAVGAFLGFVASAQGALFDWIASAPKAASDFVTGLIGGITGAAGNVIKAVTGLAGAATNAFKGALGIASPSKVMMAMGGQMADGVAGGLDDGAGDVAGASSGVANAAIKGMSSPSDSGPKGGASGGSNISVLVQIDGAGKSAMDITQEMVASVFARMALEAGV